MKRAFLYGDIEDIVYVRLPEEDPMFGSGMVGRLIKAMYGTRGAPHVWQKVVRKAMTALGFEMNPIFPCVYHHKTRDMMVVTHVDDFLCSDDKEDLKWLHKSLSKEFELKAETLGTGEGEILSASFLGRTI